MFIKKGGQRNAKIKIKLKEEFRSPFYQLYRSLKLIEISNISCRDISCGFVSFYALEKAIR